MRLYTGRAGHWSWLILLLAGTAPACDDHVLGKGVPIGTSCLRDPPLTYENFGRALLNRHCNSCHSQDVRQDQRGGAPVGVDFDEWEMVLNWAESIELVAIENNTMPPSGGTMLPDERARLAEWMRCDVLPSIGQFRPAEEAEEEEEGS